MAFVLGIVGLLVPEWVKKSGNFASAMIMTLNPLNPFTHLLFWSSAILINQLFDVDFLTSMLISLWVLIPLFFFYWFLTRTATKLLF